MVHIAFAAPDPAMAQAVHNAWALREKRSG